MKRNNKVSSNGAAPVAQRFQIDWPPGFVPAAMSARDIAAQKMASRGRAGGQVMSQRVHDARGRREEGRGL